MAERHAPSAKPGINDERCERDALNAEPTIVMEAAHG